MTQGLLLDPDRFVEAVLAFDHTLFRFEQQPSYAEPEEDDLYAAFLRGEPTSPTLVPELWDWYEQISAASREGKRVQRVRVQQNPPTGYQRFERWLDRWNIAAGEDIRYLTQTQARAIGLMPDAAGRDWWLQDSCRLIIMRFDGAGQRIRNELVTDPVEVIRACKWRDLAVHHAARAEVPDAA
jgi:hypothetical protein